MNGVIQCEQLWKVYKTDSMESEVLKDVDLKIGKGEVMAIMGPSGSGKSTLLHILGCLDKPSRGRLLIDGKDVSKMDEEELAKIRREKIGFVFQFFYLIPSLTALENVMLPMAFAGVDTGEQKRRAAELLKIVGLEGRMNYMPSQLSGGERQRVAIARSMANKPVIILADEPTGNLDSKSGSEVMKILMDLNEKFEATIILVTHDKIVASCARRTIHLKDGEIVREEKNHKGGKE